MAHFAKLDGNNNVLQVVVVDNENLVDENGNESEEVGIQFLNEVFNHASWRQTSYNGNFRRHYAGVGYKYDSVRDVFVPPQPYPSWTLDQSTAEWRPPTPCPDDGIERKWDEQNRRWVTLEELM